MKKTRMPQRLLSLVLVLMMLISVLPVSAMAAELTPSDPETGLTATDVTNELTDSDRLAIFEENMDSGKVSRSEIPADDEMVKVIVQLDADSLLDVRNRTNASMSMLDFQQTDAAKAQLKDIANLQLSVMNTMESKGIPSSFTFSYTSVVSGFAAQVPYGKIHDIKNIDGVEDVVLCQTYYTDSMGSATLGQALTAAEVAAYSNNTQYQGEGMLIGILDTGLDVNHEAFANAPAVQKLQKSSLSKLLYQISQGEDGKTNITAYSYAALWYAQKHSSSSLVLLTEDDLYKSGKVPFAFDYADADADVIPSADAVEKYGNDHGTHVAGTIAAVNGNGIGVCGVAGGTGNHDGVKLMTLQVMRDDAADDIPFNDVFPYAADNGAVIASCSWTISQTGMDQATKDGIDYFQANAGWDDTDGDGINDVQTGPMQGGLVIAGAGNSGTDKVFYPAKYKDVIGVGAIDGDMTVAWYSEYGEGIDVLAPGGNQEGSGEYNRPEIWGVYSTYPNGGYAYSAGTSMACPHVSGVAALILSKFKGQGFTAEELRNKVERSCRPLSEPMDPKYHGGIGNGLIDVTLALTEVPEEGPEKPQFEAIPAPASVRITGPVPVDGNGMPVVKYNFEYAEVVNGTAGEMTRTVLSNTYNAGEEFVYMFPGKSEAEYKFRMNAVDRYGNESEYIELQSETLEFENHAPTLLREFSDVEIRQAGEDYARLYTLVTYFEDEDAQYGDEMTFTVENSNDAVVRTELRNGRTLAVIPLTKGSCVVTVTATDTRGASTTAAINVTVLAGAGSAPTFKRQLGSLTLPAAGSFVRQYDLNDYVYDADMPDDELTFSAVSSDASVVTAAVTGTTLEVTGLKKGDATVQVTVTDRGGNSAENELFVSVAQEPGSQSGGATLRLYPNPATDYVNITLSGAGSGSADVVFYDSAARQVMKTTAELDASGTARIDGISGLTPGAYTVSVKQGGNTYKGTVLKR